MKVIAQSTLRRFTEQRKYAAAKGELALWVRVAERAQWTKLLEVQKDFTTAEAVPVRKVNYTVFNICFNAFRLVVEINYRKGILWIKNFLTHAEYSRGAWKTILEEEQEQREALRRKFRRSR